MLRRRFVSAWLHELRNATPSAGPIAGGNERPAPSPGDNVTGPFFQLSAMSSLEWSLAMSVVSDRRIENIVAPVGPTH